MAIELGVAYVSVLPSAKGFGKALDKQVGGIGKTVGGKFADDFGTSVTKSSSLGKAFKGVAALASGIFAGVAVGQMFKGFISEAEEAQKTLKQTQAVLKSTGGVAGVTAENVDKLATALSKKSGIDDEVIASGENVLLTFTKIRNEVGEGNNVFDQATTIALDMSVALGTDLQSSVIQVGKALNDPIKGITALQRVGVSFTEQQREQIKALVESGDVLGAQKLILEELNTEFAGSAEAGATASAKLSVAWGNIQEQIGTALLPVFTSVSEWLADTLPKAIDFVAETWPKITAAFDATKAWVDENWPPFRDTVMSVFNAIADFVAENWPPFRDTVIGVFEEIVAFVQENWPKLEETIVPLLEDIALVVGAILAGIYLLWRTFGDDLLKYVTNAFKHIWEFIQGALDIIGGIFEVFIGIFTLDWQRAWDGIQQIFQGFTEVVMSIVHTFVDNFKLAWQALDFVRKWLFDNIITPIENAFASFFQTIKDGFSAAVAAIGAIWDGLKAVAKAPVNFVIEWVWNKGIRRVWNLIPGLDDLPEVAMLNSGGWVGGSGNRDTVPALLTPGEFVVTKKAAQVWGRDVLGELNNPKGTIDPAVFGYAAGGYVRSPAEALAWAQSQAGKPYEFPMVGPGSYDCSGFLSAVINYIFGRNPHSRLFSSGTVAPGVAGLAAGSGTPGIGFTMGVDRPRGRPVGHVAATLMGTNIEATPPKVRTGGAARGWNNALFGEAFHLPGYGGLSALEGMIVKDAGGLLGINYPSMGVWGDAIFGAIKSIMGKVVGMLMRSVPGVKQLLDAGQAIGQIIGDVFGTETNIAAGITSIVEAQGMQNGALVKAGHGGVVGLVGEGRYDEAVVPLAPDMGGLGERNGVKIVTAHFHEEADTDALFRAARMYMAVS